MTKKEILLKQRNIENAPLTDYIGTDGYVWKMIENAMEEYHQDKLKLLGIADVSGMLLDQTKRHIDLAYLIGVFNVSGIDGLQKELTRLKEIGKEPHDIIEACWKQ